MTAARITYDLSGPRWENLDTCESVLAMPIWWELPDVIEFGVWNPVIFFVPDPETGIALERPRGRTRPDRRNPDGVPFSQVQFAVVRRFASMRLEGVQGARLTLYPYDPTMGLMEFFVDSKGNQGHVRRSWGDLTASPDTFEYYFESNLAWPNGCVSLIFRARSAFLSFDVDQLAVPDPLDIPQFQYPEELVE